MSDGGSAAVNALPSSGDVLAGKYTIVRVIGEGGMGVVYEARHAKLGNRVAIKVLREAERKVDEFVQRFEREARAAARLRGRNVARVHDVDSLPDGTPFMVMEYLEGVDLDTELAERGRLPIDEAVGYMLQACSGVAEAHSLGVIHRDLKPHNLFLCGDDPPRTVKLLDFGISKMRDEGESSVTLTRSSLGTPLYMSPEQIRSAKNADTRADIWSLGVILYEALTGTPPFDGEGPSGVIAAITADDPTAPCQIRPDIPKPLSDAILKALEKNPAERYSSVDELAEAIAPFGPSGVWSPPPAAGSNPSHHRISFSDLRVNADAITEAARNIELSDSNAVAPVTGVEPRKPRSGVIVAALLLLAVISTVVFLWTQPSEAPAARAPAVETSEPAELEAPPQAAEPVPVETARAPEVAPTVASAPTTASSEPKPAPVRPRRASKGFVPTSKKPAEKPQPPPAPEAPAPPPRPVENPLHL